MSPEPPRLRAYLLAALVLYVPLFQPRLVADGALYHEYLRSLAYDGDLNFDNERTFYTWRFAPVSSEPGFGKLRDTGYPRQRCNIGPALIWFPEFLVGRALAWMSQEMGLSVIADGYSFPERLASAITSLPLALFGLLCTLRLLRSFRSEGMPSDPTVASTLAEDLTLCLPAAVIVLLASPLPAFVLLAPTESHSMAFASSAAFLTLAVERFGRPRGRDEDVALGLSAGLAALARTQCGFLLVLFLLEPFAGLRSGSGRVEKARALLFSYLRIAAAFFLGFSPQLASNLVIFGRPMGNPDSGMRWLHPELGRLIFDGSGGLFAATPLLLPSMLGLLLCLRRQRLRGAALCLALLVQVYLNAVRRDLDGVGYGMRRLIEVLPLLSLGFAEILWFLRPRRGLVAATLTVGALACAWNVLLMGQYYLTDLSRPGLWPSFLNIASRNIFLAPQILQGLLGQGLLATALSSPPATRFVELLLFATALGLLYVSFGALERALPLLGDLFPILVLALGSALATTDAFLIYSRLATRHVRAYLLDRCDTVSAGDRIVLPPATLEMRLASAQGPDLVWRSRHLTLRRDAAYEGLLGGFTFAAPRPGIVTAEPTYPGGILDQGVLSSRACPARAPVLRVRSAEPAVTGLDLVLSYESYAELPSPVLSLTLEGEATASGSAARATILIVKQPAAESFGLDRRDMEPSWARLFPNTAAGLEGAVSMHATFEPPRHISSITVEPSGNAPGITIRGLALEIPRPRP